MTEQEARKFIRNDMGLVYTTPRCDIDDCERMPVWVVYPLSTGAEQNIEDIPKLTLCDLHFDFLCHNSAVAEAELLAEAERKKQSKKSAFDYNDPNRPF